MFYIDKYVLLIIYSILCHVFFTIKLIILKNYTICNMQLYILIIYFETAMLPLHQLIKFISRICLFYG